MNSTIGIVGVGRVGAEAANEIVRNEVADCALVDIDGQRAAGKCLDLMHSAALKHSSCICTGSDDYASLRGCRVVVIVAGQPRKPGMTRDDLLQSNLTVIQSVVPRVVEAAPDAILVMVTNPLDAMTYAAWKLSGLEPSRVIGMAGALDSARFRAFLAAELAISVEDVDGIVLGSHGNLMVPLVRYAGVGGVPVTELMSAESLERVVARTINAGTELVELLKSGSAYYAAGAAIARMVDALANGKRRVFCCSVAARGEYGLDNVHIGLPVILSATGVERIIELDLSPSEHDSLSRAARHLAQMQRTVDSLLG
jgi:malate dehydrogenase